MPPEQVIDVRRAERPADVFSIGAVLYEMLTGQTVREFSANVNEAIRQVVQDPAIPIRHRDASIPTKLASIIDKSLDLDPNMRYPDAQEFKSVIETLAI